MLRKNSVRGKLFPISLLFFIDALLTAFSFVASYALCSYIIDDISAHSMLIQLPIVVSLTSIIFLFIGIYKGYVKTSGLHEVYNIFNAICLANILTIVLVVVNGKLMLEQDLMVPLAIIIVHSILSFTALVVSRLLYKNLLHKLVKGHVKVVNVLLVHHFDKDDARILALEEYFLENGKQVVHKFSTKSSTYATELSKLKADGFTEEELYLVHGSMAGDALLTELNVLLDLRLPVFLIESKHIEQDLSSDAMQRNVLYKRLELDALFKKQIEDRAFLEHSANGVYGETILVTGAGGSIGKEFVKELFYSGVKATLILLDHSETALSEIVTFMQNSDQLRIVPKLVDLKEKKAIEKLFQNYNITLVMHTAGNNFPESLNENISKVMQENLTTTKMLADVSKKTGVRRFVFCSNAGAVHPRTTLEVSKRLTEIYLNSLNKASGESTFISVRLNRVYNSSGSGIGYMKNQITYEKPINRCIFSEHEIYSNKKDVAKALMLVANEKNKFTKDILTLKLGYFIETELVAKIILNTKLSKTLKTKKLKVLYKNVFKNNTSESFYRSSSESNLDVTNLFYQEDLEDISYSKSQIQQKIENLCISLLFDQDDISLIFDLIKDFNSDQWENLFKLQQQKSVSRKVIRLQSK